MVINVPRATKEVERILLKKGFTLEKGRDHNYYFIYKNGKKTKINTKVSHGSHKDISDGLLNKMMKQMQLSKTEFNDYFDCRLSGDDYIKVLENNKLI